MDRYEQIEINHQNAAIHAHRDIYIYIYMVTPPPKMCVCMCMCMCACMHVCKCPHFTFFQDDWWGVYPDARRWAVRRDFWISPGFLVPGKGSMHIALAVYPARNNLNKFRGQLEPSDYIVIRNCLSLIRASSAVHRVEVW